MAIVPIAVPPATNQLRPICGRFLGTVRYHCDITMATLGLNAGNGHVVSRSRPSVLSPEAVLQGRLRVVALAVIGDASLTPSRVRVVLFCLQP